MIELPSLADGLSGAVEEGSLTIPLVRRLVDDLLLVSEAETARGSGFCLAGVGRAHRRLGGSRPGCSALSWNSAKSVGSGDKWW